MSKKSLSFLYFIGPFVIFAIAGGIVFTMFKQMNNSSVSPMPDSVQSKDSVEQSMQENVVSKVQTAHTEIQKSSEKEKTGDSAAEITEKSDEKSDDAQKVLHLTPELLIASASSEITTDEATETGKTFSITGVNSKLFAKDKLPVRQNCSFLSSVKVKNTGSVAVNLYVGYCFLDKEQKILFASNFPYQGILEEYRVESILKDSNAFIIDSVPQWAKRCAVAIHAKQDKSDIPSMTLLDGTIEQVEELQDGTAKVIMNKPLSDELVRNSLVRIHGITGTYIYTNYKLLQPGEEFIFSATIAPDENCHRYEAKAIAVGVCYVNPVILSYSEKSDEKNTVEISQWTITY